jgi:hypothetical protein
MESSRGGLFVMGVERRRENVGIELRRVGEEPLQRLEPGVVAGNRRVDLHAVAGGEDDSLAHRLGVDESPIGLGERVVGQREPFEQLDRGASVRDP